MMRVVIIMAFVLAMPMLNFAKSPGKGDSRKKSSQLIKNMGVSGFGDPLTEIYRRPAGQPSVSPKPRGTNWGLLNSQPNKNSPFQLYQGQLSPSAEGTPYFFGGE